MKTKKSKEENTTMMYFNCSVCTCHFVDDFELTMKTPCNFWGEQGLSNLPRDTKKKVWTWMYSIPAEEIFEKYNLSVIPHMVVSVAGDSWETLFPGISGLPRHYQQSLLRRYAQAPDKNIFVQNYMRDRETLKQEVLRRAVRLQELN